MPADAALRANRLVRVGYDNPQKLLANNATVFRRIMPMRNVVANVLQRAAKVAMLSGDPIAVSNMADAIMTVAERNGNLDGDRLPTKLDRGSFGKLTSLGIDLSSVERFANLYYQAAKGTGTYGRAIGQFFAPQNRRKWLPILNDAIVAQASIYADEAEWRNLGQKFVVPAGTQVLYAVEEKYVQNRPRPLGWMEYEKEAIARYERNVDVLRRAGFKVTIVDYRKTMDSMHAAQARKRQRREAASAL